jgi:hypothetical protein
MQQICRQCRASFEIEEDHLMFLDKVSPVFSGHKEQIPPPTLCPECRSLRRMTWRNERSLYRRPCELCKLEKVSAFQASSPVHTYCRDCFYGDGWDAMAYGRSYDFSRSFAENLGSLFRDTPIMMLYQPGQNENCDYTNFAGIESRNCYFIFNSGRTEDCYYSRGLVESKDCSDILIGSGNQFCYSCVNCSDGYGVSFSENVAQCTDSAFLYNCRRCKNCFGCTNLVQKEYHLFNQPCSPEEFQAAMTKLSSNSFVQESAERLAELKKACIHRATNNINAEGCTGDYITASKNCLECYEAKGAEDCKWMTCSRLCKDSRDTFGFAYDSELLYEVTAVGLSQTTAFSFTSDTASDCYYCLYCANVQNCFGCVSLRHKKFCIFNKQYTQEEYEALVPKIIEAMRNEGAWGEFLPTEMSPFAYNETVAQEYFPLSREEVEERGWKWNTYESPMPPVRKSIPAETLPDSIDDIPDDVLEWALLCEATGKPYKLIKQELDFYRKRRLPVPRFHPDERYRRLLTLRNPCKIWERACAKCSKVMRTTYQPERPEIVYCESCYLAAVY